MGLLNFWDRNISPDSSRANVKYGKIISMTKGRVATIQSGSAVHYTQIDKNLFSDLKVGDQIAFMVEPDSPQSVFLVRKASKQYSEISMNQIID